MLPARMENGCGMANASITAQACAVRLWRLLCFRSPPVSPWPMQSKATEPMPEAKKCSRI